MTIEEIKAKKVEMEQKISAAIKDFVNSTKLEVSDIRISRCVYGYEYGTERDYVYNVQADVNL